MNFIKNLLIRIQSFQIARTAVVGAFATSVDLIALALFQNVFQMSASQANIPALILGSATQFFGNRIYVFHTEKNSLLKQSSQFAVAELIAMGLNAIAFEGIIRFFPFVHYSLARILGTFLVFLCFSYPAWKKIVFKNEESPQ